MRLIWLLAVGSLVCSAHGEWTAFRGARGDGVVDGGAKFSPVVSWSETNNVSWKTAIPDLGWSTPVVLDGQVWLTSATVNGNDFFVHCLDAKSGEMIHSKKIFHCDSPEPLGNSVNCYASPSPAIEPGVVYVHFGSYGTACLKSDTSEVVWSRRDLDCRHYRGPGSSVIIYKNLLILTFDGVDQQYMTALDKKTGKTVWKRERSTEWTDWDENGKPKRNGDRRKAFATPLIVECQGADQLISSASSMIYSYDPNTGAELWNVSHGGNSASVSPVSGDGLVFVTSGNSFVQMMAIRPDGNGDVTDSHVAWVYKSKDVPTTPSPIFYDGMLFLIGNRGAVTCLDAKSGDLVWRERIGGNYQASLLLWGDKIFSFSVKGKATVFYAKRAFELIAESHLPNGFMASPAVDDGALILRTKKKVYRIERPID